MDHGRLYENLFNAYRKAMQGKSAREAQEATISTWSKLKSETGRLELERAVKEKIVELQRQACQRKASLTSYWCRIPLKKSRTEQDPPRTLPKTETVQQATPTTPISATIGDDATQTKKKIFRQTPAQDALTAKIELEHKRLSIMQQQLQCGLGKVTKKDIGSVQEGIHKLEKDLARKISLVTASEKLRANRKSQMVRIVEENPNVAQKLKLRDTVGHPRLESDQTDLLEVMKSLAVFGGAAEDKRRSEAIRSCRTLDDLHKELKSAGFEISRSATYLRLLPKRGNSIEGKHHVVTLPVRLKRPESNLHSKHPDGHFCTASIFALEELASCLGPSCFFLSQDDKCRVPIGLTACQKQSPLLMHLEYQVRLPDHDWVIAERHKLIPSVYAAIKVDRDHFGQRTAVGYSGPTYIAIRSGKHDSSTAASHAVDLDTVFGLDEFQKFIKTPAGEMKPVVIMSVDGGPDENPRYAKVITLVMPLFLCVMYLFLLHSLHDCFKIQLRHQWLKC